jgi:hypothetical protein
MGLTLGAYALRVIPTVDAAQKGSQTQLITFYAQ